VLSDLHFGSDIERAQTGIIDYGATEEARCLAFVTREICEYKSEHRKTSELALLLLGDIIENNLHDPRAAAPVSEQIRRAIHLLIQTVGHVARAYGKVRVICVTGNHGRNTARHPTRAIAGKADSHETVIYDAIRAACVNLKNVKFEIPLTPYAVYSVPGNKRIFATHGDTVLKPGNPGASIQVARLENQANRINSSLRDAQEYAAFVMGHVHVPSLTVPNNGCAFVTNGALSPVGDFAVSLGMFESCRAQWLFESVEGFPVGDARLVRVDASTHRDKGLDKIIKPWVQS
jgi:predicted phosphodiesterase